MGVLGVGGENLEEGWELRPGHKMGNRNAQKGPRAAVASSGSEEKIGIKPTQNGVW